MSLVEMKRPVFTEGVPEAIDRVSRKEQTSPAWQIIWPKPVQLDDGGDPAKTVNFMDSTFGEGAHRSDNSEKNSKVKKCLILRGTKARRT